MGNLNIQHDVIQNLFFLRTRAGVARLDYSKRGKNEIEITRTYVPEIDRNKGIGSALADQAITYARERDIRVTTSCPFVKSYLKNHAISG